MSQVESNCNLIEILQVSQHQKPLIFFKHSTCAVWKKPKIEEL